MRTAQRWPVSYAADELFPGIAVGEPFDALPPRTSGTRVVTIAGRRLSLSPVFDTYWQFAARRQELYLSRLAGSPSPQTDDPILRSHRFTNVYRAADRVSQYLIRNVIHARGAPSDAADVVFRVLLFKLFNKIETWERLIAKFGDVSWSTFDFAAYREVLAEGAAEGTLYSAAYLMPPPRLGEDHKYANHLRLLELMMNTRLPETVAAAKSLRDVYEALVTYPSVGRFLAFQYTVDLNYTDLCSFSEDDFVVAGPGACDGVRKCFGPQTAGVEADVVRWMVDNQETCFGRLELEFPELFGRRLHLIDCQNLFCEVDKYSRVAHPDVAGISGRTRIKQKYHRNPAPLIPFFPPRWGINDAIAESLARSQGVSASDESVSRGLTLFA